MPGDDLLFRCLSSSTIGAVGFHGRVRDGIGWDTDAMVTRQWGLWGAEPLVGARQSTTLTGTLAARFTRVAGRLSHSCAGSIDALFTGWDKHPPLRPGEPALILGV